MSKRNRKATRPARTGIYIVTDNGRSEVWSGDTFVAAFDYRGDAVACADRLRAAGQ